jgi:hypothetical protein
VSDLGHLVSICATLGTRCHRSITVPEVDRAEGDARDRLARSDVTKLDAGCSLARSHFTIPDEEVRSAGLEAASRDERPPFAQLDRTNPDDAVPSARLELTSPHENGHISRLGLTSPGEERPLVQLDVTSPDEKVQVARVHLMHEGWVVLRSGGESVHPSLCDLLHGPSALLARRGARGGDENGHVPRWGLTLAGGELHIATSDLTSPDEETSFARLDLTKPDGEIPFGQFDRTSPKEVETLGSGAKIRPKWTEDEQTDDGSNRSVVATQACEGNAGPTAGELEAERRRAEPSEPKPNRSTDSLDLRARGTKRTDRRPSAAERGQNGSPGESNRNGDGTSRRGGELETKRRGRGRGRGRRKGRAESLEPAVSQIGSMGRRDEPAGS